MTKYRVGDEVTVRGVITAIEQHHRKPLLVTMGYSELWFSESDIATHTPKKRELKPGDMVTWGDDDETLEFITERYGHAIMWSRVSGCSVSRPIYGIRHIHEIE